MESPYQLKKEYRKKTYCYEPTQRMLFSPEELQK